MGLSRQAWRPRVYINLICSCFDWVPSSAIYYKINSAIASGHFFAFFKYPLIQSLFMIHHFFGRLIMKKSYSRSSNVYCAIIRQLSRCEIGCRKKKPSFWEEAREGERKAGEKKVLCSIFFIHIHSIVYCQKRDEATVVVFTHVWPYLLPFRKSQKESAVYCCWCVPSVYLSATGIARELYMAWCDDTLPLNRVAFFDPPSPRFLLTALINFLNVALSPIRVPQCMWVHNSFLSYRFYRRYVPHSQPNPEDIPIFSVFLPPPSLAHSARAPCLHSSSHE